MAAKSLWSTKDFLKVCLSHWTCSLPNVILLISWRPSLNIFLQYQFLPRPMFLEILKDLYSEEAVEDQRTCRSTGLGLTSYCRHWIPNCSKTHCCQRYSTIHNMQLMTRHMDTRTRSQGGLLQFSSAPLVKPEQAICPTCGWTNSRLWLLLMSHLCVACSFSLSGGWGIKQYVWEFTDVPALILLPKEEDDGEPRHSLDVAIQTPHFQTPTLTCHMMLQVQIWLDSGC